MSGTGFWFLQVRSVKVFCLDENTSTAIRIVSMKFATASKPSKKKFLLQTDEAGDLSAFTARRSCGKLCAVSSNRLGPIVAFQGLPLTVTECDIPSRELEVSAGQQVDVDIQAVNSQLQEEQLHIEFR